MQAFQYNKFVKLRYLVPMIASGNSIPKISIIFALPIEL